MNAILATVSLRSTLIIDNDKLTDVDGDQNEIGHLGVPNTCHRRLRKGSLSLVVKPYGTIWGRAVIVSILRFVTGILEPEKKYEDESRLRSVAADLSEQLN